MSEVESLESHYFDLKSKLSTGAITPDEFRDEVARLWFEDEQGRTWMIGAQTGHWYVYDHDQWMLAEPPRAHAAAHTSICPRCGEAIAADATFCGHCGYRLPEPVTPLATPAAAAAASAAAPRAKPTTTPPVVRAPLKLPTFFQRVSPRMAVAVSGATLFGLLFVCLGAIGLSLILRNGTSNPLFASAPPTVFSSRTPVATRTPTPNPSTTALARVPTAVTVTLPASTPVSLPSVVPTPIVVVIAPQSVPTSTPSAAPTSAPTSTPIADTPTPTATAPSDTPTPADSPTPAETPTPAPVVPTNTPRPPTDTPTPRPPTNTPPPALNVSGHIAYTIFNISYGEFKAYDVYVRAVDGSDKQLFAPKRRQPAYSPDGSRLVTRGMENDKFKLMVRPLGGGEQPIENTPIEAALPSWSPDGKTVLYASNELEDKQTRFYIVKASGAGDQRPFLKAGNVDLVGRYPTWLPNGQIVYSGCDQWGGSGQCGIVRVNPDGNSPLMLSNNRGDTAPAGRGSTVAFMSNRDGNWEIYSVPLDGGAARNLTNSPADDGLPTFSPNGQFIAFVSNRSGQWAVWVMRLDGSGQRMLFPLDGGYASATDLDWTSERISWGP